MFAVNWGALLGGFIGAGIPGWLAYVGMRRGRQATDAAAFGPAMLLLDRMHPDRITFNVSGDADAEPTKVGELAEQTQTARERLLIVRAGHPRRQVRELADVAQVKLGNVHHALGWQVGDLLRNRDNPAWGDHYRETHAEAEATMRDLIDANFATWELDRTKAAGRRIRGWVSSLSSWARGRFLVLSNRARHRARHAAAKVKIGRRTPGR
jgi:hypothetical protein